MGLKDTAARTGEGVGYITFVLFPRHTNRLGTVFFFGHLIYENSLGTVGHPSYENRLRTVFLGSHHMFSWYSSLYKIVKLFF